jgi:hypothetical protein
MRERSNQNYSDQKKKPPQRDTNAETFYYKKQIDARIKMIFVLQDGEEITGIIDWYDRDALKIDREKGPKILLLKHNIKYMYKAENGE